MKNKLIKLRNKCLEEMTKEKEKAKKHIWLDISAYINSKIS